MALVEPVGGVAELGTVLALEGVPPQIQGVPTVSEKIVSTYIRSGSRVSRNASGFSRRNAIHSRARSSLPARTRNLSISILMGRQPADPPDDGGGPREGHRIGLGLSGMRERVALLGPDGPTGTFTHATLGTLPW